MSKAKEDTGSAVPGLREGAQKDYSNGGEEEYGHRSCQT